MSNSRVQSRERRPESILASEADRRITTAEGKSRNADTPISVPENTPRDVITAGRDDADIFSPPPEVMADPGSEKPEDILDEDELLMTLTEEERRKWEMMVAARSTQMEKSLEDHKKWADAFTRRRMFVYCCMRKLNQSHQDRMATFDTVWQRNFSVFGKQSARQRSYPAKKAELEKRLSDPALSGSKPQKPSQITPTRRKGTMRDEEKTQKTHSSTTKETVLPEEKPDIQKEKLSQIQQSPVDPAQAKENTVTSDNTNGHLSKLSKDETASSDSQLIPASDKLLPSGEKAHFSKVEQLSTV